MFRCVSFLFRCGMFLAVGALVGCRGCPNSSAVLDEGRGVEISRPIVRIGATAASVLEDGALPLEFRVDVDVPSSVPLLIPLSISGTATGDDDFIARESFIEIPAESTRVSFALQPRADSDIEFNETVVVSLLPSDSYHLGAASVATGTLVNDDFPTVSLTAIQDSIPEDSATKIRFAVELDRPSLTEFSLRGAWSGTATSGSDYVAPSVSLKIPAGEVSDVIEASSLIDTSVEPNETVTLTLQDGEGYLLASHSSATVTLVNDDVYHVDVVATQPHILEDGTGNLSYVFSVNPAAETDISVSFSISGTARKGVDFFDAVSPLVIPAGQSQATLLLPITPDSEIEPDEFVTVTAKPQPNVEVIAPQSATISILNDDVESTNVVYFRQNGDVIEQSVGSDIWTEVAQWPVTLVNPDPSKTLHVQFLTPLTFKEGFQYFVIGSDNIQIGNDSLDAQGKPSVIRIENVDGYAGVFQNGSEMVSGYSSIRVKNLHVQSVGSTLNVASGWVGQPFVGRGAYDVEFIQVSSDGPISAMGGGILGYGAAAHDGNVRLVGCHSQGNIDQEGGGIVGAHAASFAGSIEVLQSASHGSIGLRGGGILGQSIAHDGGHVTVSFSFSAGSIGERAGGIVGDHPGGNGGDVTVANSYSLGSIGNQAGGIVGSHSFLGTILVSNSYSTGNIGMQAGGILGYVHEPSVAVHCYSSGASIDNTGGIYAESASDNASGQSAMNYSETNNGNSGWNSVQALTALSSSGTWAVDSIGPFEWAQLGPSPYSRVNIHGTTLNSAFFQTVEKGQSSVAAMDYVSNFTLDAINDGPPSSFPGITMDSSNGRISTAPDVAAGTYKIRVRHVAHDYGRSEFFLTVNP